VTGKGKAKVSCCGCKAQLVPTKDGGLACPTPGCGVGRVTGGSVKLGPDGSLTIEAK